MRAARRTFGPMMRRATPSMSTNSTTTTETTPAAEDEPERVAGHYVESHVKVARVAHARPLERLESMMRHLQASRHYAGVMGPARVAHISAPSGCGKRSLLETMLLSDFVDPAELWTFAAGVNQVEQQFHAQWFNERLAADPHPEGKPSVFLVRDEWELGNSPEGVKAQRTLARVLRSLKRDPLRQREFAFLIASDRTQLDSHLQQEIDLSLELATELTTSQRKLVYEIFTRDSAIENDTLDWLAEKSEKFSLRDMQQVARLCLDNAVVPSNFTFFHSSPDLHISQDCAQESFHSYEPLEKSWYTSVSVPDTKFEDIGGLSEVKQKLKEAVVWPIERADEFERFKLPSPTGLLMYGPPGTGKTMLAKAVASQFNSSFICVKGPELKSKWYGESTERLREVFAKARAAAPTVIFFDELDSIGRERTTEGQHRDSTHSGARADDDMVNTLLAELDGVNPASQVFVMAATNRPYVLDPALLRPGRISDAVEIQLPDEEARRAILESLLRGCPLEEEEEEEGGSDDHSSSMSRLTARLAGETRGLSGADLAHVVSQAKLEAIRGTRSTLSTASLERLAKEATPSVPSEDIQKLKEFYMI